jgi:hypothetical protein
MILFGGIVIHVIPTVFTAPTLDAATNAPTLQALTIACANRILRFLF